MKKLAVVTFFVLSFTLAPGVRASDRLSSWSLGVKVGLGLGSVTQPEKDDPETLTDESKQSQKFTIGGVPIGVGVIRDVSRSLSLATWVSAMVDMPNKQLSRQGIEGGAAWHLAGGARKTVHGHNKGVMISENSYQLSLGARGGILHYAAATQNRSKELSGAVFEGRVGIEYRKGAFGAEFYVTALSLPASTERLATRSTELAIIWRD